MVRRPIFQSRRANSGTVLPDSCNRDGDCAAPVPGAAAAVSGAHLYLVPFTVPWIRHGMVGSGRKNISCQAAPRQKVIIHIPMIHDSPQAYRRGHSRQSGSCRAGCRTGCPSRVTRVGCRRGFNGGVGDSDAQRVGGDEAIIDGQRECNCGIHIDCRSGEGCDKL